MAREGIGTIIMAIFSAILMTTGAYVTQSRFAAFFAALIWLAAILTIYFFRDPARVTPVGDHLILAPADGRIVDIVTEPETLFIKEDVQRISIFLSIFDVHINRIPVTGEVTYFDYRRGKFFGAYRERASLENEQTVIGIRAPGCNLLLKQIAGFIARRIVCEVREGTKVTAGERFGMIKFGSRVDLALPKNVHVRVKTGQKVKAGQTIIGTIDEKI